jgi:hypothetical protein
VPQTRRADADTFDMATRMLRAQAAAEKTAIEHVRFLQNFGVPLEETSAAIGIVAQIARTERSVPAAS